MTNGLEIGVVVITKDRPLNLTQTLANNLKYMVDIPIVVVDASDVLTDIAPMPSNFHHIKASRLGQYNQKTQGADFLKLEFDVSHVVFFDDDIYIYEDLLGIVQESYSLTGRPPENTALSLYISTFENRWKIMDFLKSHSFRPGVLSKNTFGNNSCVGFVKEIDWALGGACCWPVSFCPQEEHEYPIKKGKAYLEDAYLSCVYRGQVKIFSSKKTKIEHVDAYLSKSTFGESFKDGIGEGTARRLICRKFAYFNFGYFVFSVISYSFLIIVYSFLTFRFNKLAYALGMVLGLSNKKI